jgi:DNA repair exonuclease SbcCD ATPase subunit
MNTPTMTSSRGTPQPNPRYFGFKGGAWRELQKLLDEGEKLRREAKNAYRELQEADEEIKRLEGELREQRAAALRGGPEPDEGALEKVKQLRVALNERIRDYGRAGEMVDAELRELVAIHREEWDAEVAAKGEKVLAEAQQIAEALAAKLSEAAALVGVHSWLESSGQSYTPATPATISIEHLLHERRRELGLLDVGVIG